MNKYTAPELETLKFSQISDICGMSTKGDGNKEEDDAPIGTV